MDDPQIIELLIEAQRGLIAAQTQITSAIEEVNSERQPPRGEARDQARDQTANLAIAKAVEMNTDFLLYARRASTALLERIAPGPLEDKF